MANVDVAKELMLKETESLSEIRNTLREQFYKSSPEERIRIKRDFEESEREIRRINIISSALVQLPDSQNREDGTEPNSESEQQPISLHWMDKFNEYARANNEDWRKDLLANALAMEAKKPGIIGPRALWLIGTIEENLFHAYASILDVSANISGGYVVPNHLPFNEKPVPNSLILGSTIGSLVFMLSDLGLIGETLNSIKQIPENSQIIASYGNKGALIKTKRTLNIRGIIPTLLGDTLANLYTPKPNELGLEIYNKWLESINETVADKQKINIIRT